MTRRLVGLARRASLGLLLCGSAACGSQDRATTDNSAATVTLPTSTLPTSTLPSRQDCLDEEEWTSGLSRIRSSILDFDEASAANPDEAARLAGLAATELRAAATRVESIDLAGAKSAIHARAAADSLDQAREIIENPPPDASTPLLAASGFVYAASKELAAFVNGLPNYPFC